MISNTNNNARWDIRATLDNWSDTIRPTYHPLSIDEETPDQTSERVRRIVDNIVREANTPRFETGLRGASPSYTILDEMEFDSDTDRTYTSDLLATSTTTYISDSLNQDARIPGQLTRTTALEEKINIQQSQMKELQEKVDHLESSVTKLQSQIKLILEV